MSAQVGLFPGHGHGHQPRGTGLHFRRGLLNGLGLIAECDGFRWVASAYVKASVATLRRKPRAGSSPPRRISISFVAETPSNRSLVQGTPSTVSVNGTTSTALVKDASGNPVTGKDGDLQCPQWRHTLRLYR